jgi:hypothetical protein
MSWYDKFKTGTKDYLTKGKSYASSFWYDDYDTSYDVLETYGGFKKQDLDLYKKTNNLYKLASVRRAISNFVQIVTQKNIPVTFATKSDSKTDGKKVILSADVEFHAYIITNCDTKKQAMGGKFPNIVSPTGTPPPRMG